jgi:alpha-ketoglutarate-dependent taurine dioxygenase
MAQLSQLEARDLTPAFGTEIVGFEPQKPLDAETCAFLRDAFDRRGVLLFRDLDIDHAYQVYLATMLIRKEHLADGSAPGVTPIEDTFYISNERPNSAAPYGRLQFHSDTMWADNPFEVLSLYGVNIEQPVVPTTYVSATRAWATLPEELRARVDGREALHTAGEVRRGDLTDVALTTVAKPPSTTMPIGRRHPRTGETILYICEQMTKEVVDLPPDESEQLLDELFAHLYDPEHHLNHYWREGDLVVWDNEAVQHARPNVDNDGPARTLRKVAFPLPKLSRDQLPAYSRAE